ncbi:hypothetical protein [Candidatus Thiosymbion oneisti]|uniref:hypothetical protein n=1 Tax=Candidatus Thiosymbion oneisti TaxID=589554 RepID=UPI00114CFF4F|nr:hypothetical protein [Candidatus Thiosymbion oneisti]
MGKPVSVYTILMMASNFKRFGVPILVLSLLVLVGCAGGRRPVLYPNAHFHSVGEARAHADVDHCLRSAKDFGAPVYGGTDVARDTATGGVIGGAAAGAWGLVRDGEKDAGNRALAGAAAGGAAGLVRGALRAGKPSQTFRGFVNRCLSERGYDVIGWQ